MTTEELKAREYESDFDTDFDAEVDADSPSLEALALEAWIKANRDFSKAMRLLRKTFDDQPELDGAVKNFAAGELLRKVIRQQRTIRRGVPVSDVTTEEDKEIEQAAPAKPKLKIAVSNPAATDKAKHDAADRELMSFCVRSWLEMMLPFSTDIRLGDADKAALETSIAKYRKQARTELAEALWLERISRKLPDGKTVREVLTDADIERLRTA